MKYEIRYCQNCKKYSLDLVCQNCKIATIKNIPLRFSPEDKGRKYRILDLKKTIHENH